MDETTHNDTNEIHIRPVTRHRIRNLKKLFAERVHSIPHSWVNDDHEVPVQIVGQYLSLWGFSTKPFTDWFEAIDATGQLSLIHI